MKLSLNLSFLISGGLTVASVVGGEVRLWMHAVSNLYGMLVRPNETVVLGTILNCFVIRIHPNFSFCVIPGRPQDNGRT